jgi:hypothetical protein
MQIADDAGTNQFRRDASSVLKTQAELKDQLTTTS